MRKTTTTKISHSQKRGNWLNRSIRAQFSLTTILLAVMPVILVGTVLAWFSLSRAREALKADAFAKLVTLRSDRIKALEAHFIEVQSDMNVLLETVATLRQEAVRSLSAANRNKSQALVRLFETWRVDTLDIASDPGVVAGLVSMEEGFHSLGEARTRTLYLGKELLNDAGDRSLYSRAHAGQHAFFTHYIELHGYLDALLLDLDGHVIYSTRKSDIFGTNLTTGTYKDSRLAGLYKVLRSALPTETYISDVAPFGDELAMFIGAPIYSNTLQIGILVYQLPFEPINTIVQERTGFKNSTESYLLGKEDDHITYRSDRVIKTGKIGDLRPDVGYNQLAFAGFGSMITLGSTGIYELAVYEPIPIPGLTWAIITSGSAKENFVPQAEGDVDDYYVKYTREYGYYDMFLIQPDGFVFYSVKHEKDFETNLMTGPYKDSNLGQLVAKVLNTKRYGVADFAFYEPSGGAPAAFVAAPLIKDGQIELIVAVQLPEEPIAAIVTDYTGLGESGETLLAGPDKLARSQLLNVEGPAILKQELNTYAINQALAGHFNTGDIVDDYRGIKVFNAWGPVKIAGADFHWALAAKIDQSEALKPVYELQNVVVIGSLALVVLVTLLSVAIGTTLSNRLVRPIIGLTETAQIIASGDFSAKPPALERADEVGVLSNALNTMVERLEDSISNLQASNLQVQARTEQLEANQRAIQVVFSAGGAFQTDELLALVVNLIRDRFNLYHVQIYLLDEEKQHAILRQSTGFAGQQLLARKHKIPMERTSLVTTSIKEARPVLVADVAADPNFLPNPLLPDTRSELVVPFKVGDAVLGALDAQSRDAGYFTDDAVALFETMIGQIGLMFQNAQLFTNVTERTEALTIFTNQLSVAADVGRRLSTILDPDYLLSETVELLRSRFGFYHTHIYLLDEATNELVVRAGSGEVGRVLRERRHSIPLNREHSRVARAAREQATQVVNDTALDSDFLPNPLLPQTRSELSVPMIVGNRVLGVLDIQDDQPDRFGQAERDTFTTLAAQVATALDNARLFAAQDKAEQAIRELARQNELVLNSVAEGIFGVDQNGVTTFVNPAAAQMLGYTAEQLIGQRHHDLIHHHRSDGSEYPAEECKVYAAYRDGKTHHGDDEVYWRSDGTSFPVAYTSTPILDEGGAILGAVVTFQNITEQRKAQEEIDRQVAILNNSSDFIALADLTGRLVYINVAGARMLGYEEPEDFIGKVIADSHDADGLRLVEQTGIPTAIQTGFWRGENALRRVDGVLIPVDQAIFPILDASGKVQYLATIMSDITERKQTEEEIRKRAIELQTVAEVSTAASSTLQTDILLQNVVDLTKERFGLYHAHIYLLDEPAPEALLKAELAEVGKLMRERKLILRAGAGEAGRQMLAEGRSISLFHEHSLVARAARTRQGVVANDVRTEPDFLPNPLLPDTASEMAIPIIVGDRVLGVLDVQSERVGRFTEQDVAIKATLARQVGTALENARLFEETQEAADKLREVDRLKSEFLANMSHELRTPLNSIIGYTQLLLADLEGQITGENYEDLKSIGSNGKHLLGLINDILDLAKIEAGRLELHKEEVEVGVLLDTVQSSNAGLFFNKELEFIVEAEEDLPVLWADHIRLVQVLNNLISNAAKFTEQGSVTLRAYRDNGDLCLSVIDTGIGIAQNDLEDIFEKFRQVDGSFTRRAEGTGLGLPITRHLVQMHGGRVEVQSEVGKGSTFTVRLPIESQENHE